MNRWVLRIVDFQEAFTRSLGRYVGFKCVFLALWSLLLALLGIVLYSNGMIAAPHTFDEWVLFCEYIALFWVNHLPTFAVFVIVYTLVAWLDVLQFFRNPFPETDRPRRADVVFDQHLRQINRILAFGLAWMVVVMIPVLHLSSPSVLNRFLYIAAVPLFGIVAKETINGVRDRRNKRPVDIDLVGLGGSPSTISPQTRIAQRELAFYSLARRESPMSQSAMEFVTTGSPGALWNGFRGCFQRLATFLGVDPRKISLHENTTRAIRHALEQIVDDNTMIVHTDMEYPSVIRTATALAERADAGCRSVEVLDDHLAGEANAEVTIDKISRECERIREHNPEVRLVVITSHVAYRTGLVIDIVKLRESIGHDAVLIVDGAQAVGNIFVNAEVFQACDCYATSGHKWLLGAPTLGILVSNDDELACKGIENGITQASERPFSTIDFNIDTYDRETIDLEPMVSLNANLAKLNESGAQAIGRHNLDLAKEFAHIIQDDLGVSVVEPDVRCGIVTIRVADAPGLKRQLQRRRSGHLCQDLNEKETDADQRHESFLRFSFHCYLRRSDVYEVARDLMECMNQRQARRRVFHRSALETPAA